MALPDDRVPTLVQYCQRVAAVHVDGRWFGLSALCIRTQRHTAISSLGDELRYDLVKPILERCTVDQLLRLEQASEVCNHDLSRTNASLNVHPVLAEGHAWYDVSVLFKKAPTNSRPSHRNMESTLFPVIPDGC